MSLRIITRPAGRKDVRTHNDRNLGALARMISSPKGALPYDRSDPRDTGWNPQWSTELKRR